MAEPDWGYDDRQARHPRLRGRRIRGDKRVIPMHDAERGRYYRCWNCGFVIDSRRDELGDSQSRSGNRYEDHSIPAYGAELNGDPLTITPMWVGLDMSFIALPIVADGTAQTVVHSHKVVGTGCPFCHTKNWK